MQEIYNEITKEKYDRYKSMSYSEFTKEIKSNLSDTIRYGYGYYGCRLRERDGKYYTVMTIGSSCD